MVYPNLPAEGSRFIGDVLEHSDQLLSPALRGYVERRVDLSTARTEEEQTGWAGTCLYVQELAGELKVRLNNVNAPAITLREGDFIKAPIQQVYLTNEANSFWGTAVILLGLGEFEVMPFGERDPVVVYFATGATALALSTTEGRRFKLDRVTVHLSAAPTTSQDLTLTLNANRGAAYDVPLLTTDPSVGSVTDIVFTPDGEWVFEAGDELDLAFSNTDARTYGAQIVVRPA